MSDRDTARAWHVFDADTPVLTYPYTLGLAHSNALAVGTGNGLVVVSPPYRAPQRAFDALSRYGPVRALVASNAFHHMGIPDWKARFPEAAVFAPAQSVARVKKKTGLDDVRALGEAAAITGPRLELVDMPYYRTGEALVRIQTARGLAWYVTDIILNLRSLPSNPIVRLLFKLTGSAPGLRFNKIGPKLMVKDGRALKQWLREEFERTRPRWVIAMHGDIADLEAERDAVRKLFA